MKRLAVAIIASLFFSASAHADAAGEVSDVRNLVAECVSEGKDICVVFGATQLLTDVELLNHFYTEDREGLDAFIVDFERASYRIASNGRPDFRKFLAENAIWTMDYYNERFLSRVEPDYNYENVRHFYAAYQLARAAACDAVENDACTESALWYVKNAQDKNYWDQVVERFAIPSEQHQDQLSQLFAKYEGRYE